MKGTRDAPGSYDGIMGKDKYKCVICGGTSNLMYFCKCTPNCCIRLCMNCRDSRTHIHDILSHFKSNKIKMEKNPNV